MRSDTEFPLVAKIINGTIAGVIGVTCCFPLDLVKTRLQNQRVGPDGEKMYSSILDCFRKVYRAEGLRGMYRGVAVTVSMAAPEKMVKFTANDVYRQALRDKNGKLSIFRQTIAGALTGVTQIFISSPLELMKINLQMFSKAENTELKRPSAILLFQNIIRERGLIGIYRGIGPTAARDIPFSMLYFPLFAALNDLGPRRPDGTAVAWCSLLSGFVSGLFSAVVVTPMDVIKTRIQSSSPDRGCKGSIDCVRDTYQREGVSAFFKGGLCRMMVLAPLFGIAQCCYYLGVGESIIKFIQKSF